MIAFQWGPFAVICIFAIVCAVPVAIGTIAHLRENKRLFGAYFP